MNRIGRTVRWSIVGAGLAVGLSACGGETAETPMREASVEAVTPEAGAISLSDVVSGDWRPEADIDRDQYRNPAETLAFFGVQPDMTVVEIWPGRGWYTRIIAPYLASGGGTYYAAGFDPEGASERALKAIASFDTTFVQNPDLYGSVKVTAFSSSSGPIAAPGEADMVLTFRNVHNWMSGGFADKAFTDFYEVLAPGGVLGVVDHRLPEEMPADASVSSGYVHQSAVIKIAEAAGFEFVAASEVNANPADTADHPFGVWTLKPRRRSSPSPSVNPDPDFDREAYDAIGESDRMTLKFRKPITADGALLE